MNSKIAELGFRPRDGDGAKSGSGVFRYYDTRIKENLEIQWDGAGIDNNGKVVLIEEEETPSSIHIHGHLARVELQMALHEKISKLIWIVPECDYSALRRIVDTWMAFRKPHSFPEIEYRSYALQLLA